MNEQPADIRKPNGNGKAEPRSKPASDVPPRRLLDFSQAQRYLGNMSRTKLRALVEAQKLPIVTFPVGKQERGKWHFDLADLDRLIQSSKTLY